MTIPSDPARPEPVELRAARQAMSLCFNQGVMVTDDSFVGGKLITMKELAIALIAAHDRATAAEAERDAARREGARLKAERDRLVAWGCHFRALERVVGALSAFGEIPSEIATALAAHDRQHQEPHDERR